MAKRKPKFVQANLWEGTCTSRTKMECYMVCPFAQGSACVKFTILPDCIETKKTTTTKRGKK